LFVLMSLASFRPVPIMMVLPGLAGASGFSSLAIYCPNAPYKPKFVLCVIRSEASWKESATLAPLLCCCTTSTR